MDVRNDEEAGMGEIHLRAVKIEKNNQPKEQGVIRRKIRKQFITRTFQKKVTLWTLSKCQIS